jgi:hemin uptake protein HemP
MPTQDSQKRLTPQFKPPVNAGVVVRSETLLGTTNACWIEHQGLMYRLTSTKNGKLILTK